MADLTLLIEATGALAGAGGVSYAKHRAPRLYWSTVGLPLTWGRFTWSYRSTMDVCGLTVQPSGLRAFMTRNLSRRSGRWIPRAVRRGLRDRSHAGGIFARAPKADEVSLLQLPPGEPVVELHRTTYTADGTVVEFAIGVHAASRFAWEYDFKVPDSAKDREDQP
ncbi:hypothetical protein SVIOM342S_02649 [Streptomyces violaceorubidus]